VLAEEVDEELRNIKDGTKCAPMRACVRACLCVSDTRSSPSFLPATVESAATPWTFNFAEKDKRKWHRDSSDDEADNERGASPSASSSSSSSSSSDCCLLGDG
jgi:hypothetical protein